MNLPLLILKFHPCEKWSLRRIPRVMYDVYKIWKNENPDATERELAVAVFNRRFKIMFFEKYQLKARMKSYFEIHREPENLVDTCTAIAMIEFNMCPSSSDTYSYIKEKISLELFKLGYRLP